MQALRDTMKGLVAGTTVMRPRDDIRPDLRMAVSGRNRVCLEADHSRVLVLRVLHERMDHPRHLQPDDGERTDR